MLDRDSAKTFDVGETLRTQIQAALIHSCEKEWHIHSRNMLCTLRAVRVAQLTENGLGIPQGISPVLPEMRCARAHKLLC